MCCLRSSLKKKKNNPLLPCYASSHPPDHRSPFHISNSAEITSWKSPHLDAAIILAPKMSALLAAATHSACELCMHYLSPLHRVLCFMRETSPIYQHPLYPSTAWRSTCCYSNYSQATALSLLQITGRRDVDWLNLRLKQTNTLSRHFLPTAFPVRSANIWRWMEENKFKEWVTGGFSKQR